jgi:hypothetical protein
MKSFVDFIQEDTNIPKSKEKDDGPKKEPEISIIDFSYNISRGLKVVHNLEDYSEDNKKQMEFVYTFGKRKSPFPYEVTVTSREFYRKAWDFEFTKGFDKLKSKDKNTIENCLKGVIMCMDHFVTKGLDTDEPEKDAEYLCASISWKDDEMKKIIIDFFKDTNSKNFMLLKYEKYQFDHSFESGSQYSFVARQKK